MKRNAILTLFTCFILSIGLHAQEPQGLLTATNMENVEYPFPVHFIHLNIQKEEVQLAYMDVNPAKPNGKTIMLLHGKNFSGAYWGQTAQALADKGYRVIIPDQLGFGKSSKPNHIQYSFQLLSQNTKAILDSLNIQKLIVLGHSMGGMVATRFTLMYPDMVEKLILEDPIGLEDWKLKIPAPSVESWYTDELKQTYASMKQYQLTSYYGGQWKPEYDKWLNMQAGWIHNIDYPRIAWNSALLYDMIFTQPVYYEFENIEVQTLLIIGLSDKTAVGKNKASKEVQATLGNYSVLGKETAKKIKHSKLVEIPDVGHCPHIQAYDQFINPVLEFLSN